MDTAAVLIGWYALGVVGTILLWRDINRNVYSFNPPRCPTRKGAVFMGFLSALGPTLIVVYLVRWVVDWFEYPSD